MKTIKGVGSLKILVARSIARVQKKRFEKYINRKGALQALSTLSSNSKIIDCEVISFSSNKDFSEQVLSILSFIRYVGTPAAWLIYSDGTHGDNEIEKIKAAFSFLKVIKEDVNNFQNDNYLRESLRPFKKELVHYAEKSPLGMKLLLYLNFKIKRTTIFLDSDVLFYEKSSCLQAMLQGKHGGWFLPDEAWGSLDSRFLNYTIAESIQVNAGFFIALKDFTTVTEGLTFLKTLDFKYEYFSEQTIFHIIISNNNFIPLNTDVFKINSGDQFLLKYLCSPKNIAIRHYTTPVRHKMWQKNWYWHLSL